MITSQLFGRTGHASTRIIFGAYALSKANQAESDRALEILLEYGVNHIDTAPMYGNAEKRVGAWMKQHRADFFLATKTRHRTRQEAWEGLQRSLKTLRVEYVDLWQMHGLTNPVGWETAMGPGGALEALLEARDQGLVRFLGVTGHGVQAAEMHLRSLERFGFDAVMLPYNYGQMQNQAYASAFNQLAEVCRQRNTALQSMQSIARRRVGKGPRKYNIFFYEPLETQDAIQKSVHWALGLPGGFVISAGDMHFLPGMLEAASCFEQRPSEAEMRALAVEYEMRPVFS